MIEQGLTHAKMTMAIRIGHCLAYMKHIVSGSCQYINVLNPFSATIPEIIKNHAITKIITARDYLNTGRLNSDQIERLSKDFGINLEMHIIVGWMISTDKPVSPIPVFASIDNISRPASYFVGVRNLLENIPTHWEEISQMSKGD